MLARKPKLPKPKKKFLSISLRKEDKPPAEAKGFLTSDGVRFVTADGSGFAVRR